MAWRILSLLLILLQVACHPVPAHAAASSPVDMASHAKVAIPAAFRDFLQPARYKVAYGGRGSAKSESFARILLLRGLESRRRVLCARELQTSIKDSVHQTLLDIATDAGMPYCEYRGELVAPNGTRFLYRGLRHNVTEIKSLKGITDCWVEEAQVVSEDSWKLLTPTIREPNSEIWVTFNPDQKRDPTYQRCVVQPQPGSIVRKINWTDNPFFPSVLREEKDWAYQIDPDAADWVWGGNVRKISDAIIFGGRYRVEPFVVDPTWTGPLQGVDWGFATDPSVMVRCYYDEPNRTLYVHGEAWGLRVENDDLPALFLRIQNADIFASRADSARPETINHVRKRGFPKIGPCKKWPGSVEDGIEWLLSQRIVIHPACTHTAEEASLYSYARAKRSNDAAGIQEGDVLPQIVDKHNHCWDAIRYACEPLIRAKSGTYAGSKSRQYAGGARRRVVA
jgi:phage terminase large subunit